MPKGKGKGGMKKAGVKVTKGTKTPHKGKGGY